MPQPSVTELKQAEKLIHEWMEANQVPLSPLVLDAAVTAECAVMDAIDFLKAGI